MTDPRTLGKQIAQNAMRRASIESAWNNTEPGRHERIKAAVSSTPHSDEFVTAAQDILHRLPDNQYITKDSGQRKTFATGMVRDISAGKPRYDLISPLTLPLEKTMTYRHAMLMARGAEKYGDRNWEKARTDEEYARFKQSAYRHFLQWFHGEDDEDHAAAVYFNIAGAEYVQQQQLKGGGKHAG
jgi:hypothetical protein